MICFGVYLKIKYGQNIVAPLPIPFFVLIVLIGTILSKESCTHLSLKTRGQLFSYEMLDACINCMIEFDKV